MSCIDMKTAYLKSSPILDTFSRAIAHLINFYISATVQHLSNSPASQQLPCISATPQQLSNFRMNRTESRRPLLQHDFLDADTNGESSSGYESNDSLSLSRDPSPAPSPRERISDQSPVMVFKSTSNLQNSLAFILSMPELCDVTFLVGEDEVPVHGVRAILATRSSSLYQLILQHQRKALEAASRKKRKFKKSPPPPQKLLISVPFYQVETFRRFITFLHSGKAKVDVHHVVGLLCASAEFGMKGLHTACLDFIGRCKGQGHRNILMSSARMYQEKKPAQNLLAELS